MAREAYPDTSEGAAVVSPEITIQLTDNFDESVENFFAPTPEGQRRMELLDKLVTGTRIAIWDGLGAQYGTLTQSPQPTGDPRRYVLDIADAATGGTMRRSTYLESITPVTE